MKKEYTVRCFLNNKLSLRRKVSLFRNMTKYFFESIITKGTEKGKIDQFGLGVRFRIRLSDIGQVMGISVLSISDLKIRHDFCFPYGKTFDK